MAVDLHSLADQVNDEKSFIDFVAALGADWDEEREIEVTKPSKPFSSGALGWQNGTVGAMLGAAAAWGDTSINGLKLYEKPLNPWCRAAHILLMGKLWE